MLIKRFVDRSRQNVEAASDKGPVEAQAQVPETPVETVSAPAPVESPGVAAAETGGGALKKIKESAGKQRTAHRAALDFLNILKSLAPVFKAVTIYPGHDAPADQVAAAVRKLSKASVDLADYIANTGDALEVDSAWARKTLHEFTAELVSSYWISTVISKGGSAGMPDISPEFFKPSIQAVMALPGDMPRTNTPLNLSANGAVQLSMLKGLTPISIEIEKFSSFISLHVPGIQLSTDSLIGEIGQFLMEQALIYQERFINENPEASEDDRRVMLQAMIGHSSSVILSAWEYCKGEVYSNISNASSSKEAQDYLAGSEFTHGFPLALLKRRTEESMRRLVGSASYALSMMQRQPEEPKA